jgi:hypothetical protein
VIQVGSTQGSAPAAGRSGTGGAAGPGPGPGLALGQAQGQGQGQGGVLGVSNMAGLNAENWENSCSSPDDLRARLGEAEKR